MDYSMENNIWVLFKSSEIQLNVLNRLFLWSFEDLECGRVGT